MRTSLSPAAAAALVPDGAVVMIGGFMGVGTPHRVIRALVERGVRGLTVVANDTARPGVGIGLLISAGCVAKAIVSHIGTNPETQARMIAGEIEVALLEHPEVSEVAVTAGPDEDLGERIIAWVVAEDTSATPDPKDLINHVAQQLAPHKRPREVHFLEELPRNAMGKVVKQRLGTP